MSLPYPSTLNPGAPFQVPPLPQHYVQRPESFAAVKAMLLDESISNTLVISAIYGMGGIGKSVMAAALAQDSEIQQRFPDGVLWVTLGQQPNLLSMINLWIQALGDYDYQPTTVDAASLHLETLLTDKHTLLVVDDVWHREHVIPFRIGGPGCCVLVTTRQTQIFEASRYDLDLMTPQQSLELLTRCLSTPLSDPEQTCAKAFAKEVGYLPLALELAAAQIKNGITWDELLQTFQAEMADPTRLDIDSDVALLSDEALQKWRSLVASFKLSFKLLSPQQLEYFAWFGIVPEDVSLNPQMASTLWGLSPLAADNLLQVFRERALLLPQVQRDNSQPTYRIHDLVHDFAKNLLTHEQYLGDLTGLGLTVKAAHGHLLERYYRQTQNGLWHTVPVDGYIHSHLVWHFEQSGQPELIHQLLQESTVENRGDGHNNGWYDACEQLGQTANFVSDVAYAWQLAEALYEQNAAESITLQCRYALITTTLNSLAKNVPPELITRLVKTGIWQPAQGLAYVRQTQEQTQRWRGLVALAPHLPETLMGEALSVVRSLSNGNDRMRALNGLVPHLPTALMHEALATARTIQNQVSRAYALIGLLQYLPELVGETLAVICTIQEESSLSNTLTAVAPYLSASLMDEALAVVSTMVHPVKVTALTGLAPYIPESLMDTALAVIRSMEDGHRQAEALSELAPYLPESLMDEVLVLVHESSCMDNALKGLAPHLPESFMRQALAMMYSIGHNGSRARALSELIQYLPESLMGEALMVARSMQDESDRANALSELIQYLPESLIGEALMVARSMQDESHRANALIDLVPYVPEVLNEALTVVRSIQRAYDRANALIDLIPYAPEALNEALTVARSIERKAYQVYAFIQLVQYVPELVGEALTLVRSIQADYDQYQALTDRLNHLIEVTRVTLKAMHKALAALCSMEEDDVPSHSRSELTSFIPDSLMGEAVAVARAFQARRDRENPNLFGEFNNVWVDLAKVAPEVMGEALAALRSIEDNETRVNLLGELAPYIPKSLMGEALAVVRSMQQGRLYQDDALYQLMPYIPESLMGDALALACSDQDKYSWTSNLCRLARYIPESLMGDALALVGEVQEFGSDWTSALSCLARSLSKC